LRNERGEGLLARTSGKNPTTRATNRSDRTPHRRLAIRREHPANASATIIRQTTRPSLLQSLYDAIFQHMETIPKRRGNPDNIHPHTSQEARANGRKGGIASGIAKREKKLLSQVYADMLADEFGLAGQGLTLSGIIAAVLARADSSTVSMLKEIREATEGSRVQVDGEMAAPCQFVFVDPPAAPA